MSEGRIEKFLGRIGRSEGVLVQQQRGARGTKFDRICNSISQIRELRQRVENCATPSTTRTTYDGTDNPVMPSNPGYGCTGEATIRASRGGTLEPGFRSNR